MLLDAEEASIGSAAAFIRCSLRRFVFLLIAGGLSVVVLLALPFAYRVVPSYSAVVASLPARVPTSYTTFTSSQRQARAEDVAVSPGSPTRTVGAPAETVHFVYLVTGAGAPAEKWLRLSERPGVNLLYAAWRDRPAENVTSSYRSVVVFFYPNSTWSATRNFLYSQALRLEAVWRRPIDYLLFADEDVELGYREAAKPAVLHLTDQPHAFGLLHRRLAEDWPARASVAYTTPTVDVIKRHPVQCVQSCAFDGALDIFHRSAAPLVLPYSLRFERTSWPIAQLILNLRSQALAEQHCNLYQEVFVNTARNAHSTYPIDYGLISNASVFVTGCLATHGLPFSQRPGEKRDAALGRALRRPGPGVRTP